MNTIEVRIERRIFLNFNHFTCSAFLTELNISLAEIIYHYQTFHPSQSFFDGRTNPGF
jgi:hypothetical protein